jgi:hypothetical protein
MSSTTMIKAEPGYYVLSIKEIECGDVVIAKHPVIAFDIVPFYDERRYETRPITAADHSGYDSYFNHDHKQTLLTPQGMVYEDGSPPCSLHTYLEVLRNRYGERLYLHVSMSSTS